MVNVKQVQLKGQLHVLYQIVLMQHHLIQLQAVHKLIHHAFMMEFHVFQH